MSQTLALLEDDTSQAAGILADGGLVAFPTETVYGLGGDATNDLAVAKIFAAKGRPSFNPLIVHVPSLEAAHQFATFDETALVLANRFWPGPLTLVLPSKGVVAPLVSAGLATVAIRVPAHPLAQKLLKASNRPIAAPSANPSGRISPTSAQHVLEGLSGKIDAVMDGGPCDVGLESTIIGFEPVPTLLRPGGLATEEISALIGPIADHEGGISAPGQMTSHYAPNARVRLNVSAPAAGEVYLGFGSFGGQLNLSPSGDLIDAAANLFGHLRALDALNRPIAVAPIPNYGLGVAINDRLRRAAAPREQS